MWRRMMMGGVVLLLIASVASAQQPRRGRGGFGGPGGPGGFQGSPATLLGIPEVQKELGVTDDQKKQVDEVLGELREQMQASFGNFQELQNLSQAEREKRFAESRAKSEAANKQADEKLGKILDIQEASRPQRGAFDPNLSDEDRRALFAKMREQREKAQIEILAVLTDAQKEKWAEMKGKEFKFPEPRGGFGGPGGRGQAGRGNEERKRPERKKDK